MVGGGVVLQRMNWLWIARLPQLHMECLGILEKSYNSSFFTGSKIKNWGPLISDNVKCIHSRKFNSRQCTLKCCESEFQLAPEGIGCNHRLKVQTLCLIDNEAKLVKLAPLQQNQKPRPLISGYANNCHSIEVVSRLCWAKCWESEVQLDPRGVGFKQGRENALKTLAVRSLPNVICVQEVKITQR